VASKESILESELKRYKLTGSDFNVNKYVVRAKFYNARMMASTASLPHLAVEKKINEIKNVVLSKASQDSKDNYSCEAEIIEFLKKESAESRSCFCNYYDIHFGNLSYDIPLEINKEIFENVILLRLDKKGKQNISEFYLLDEPKSLYLLNMRISNELRKEFYYFLVSINHLPVSEDVKDVPSSIMLYNIYIIEKAIEELQERVNKNTLYTINLSNNVNVGQIKLLFCVLKAKGWIDDFTDKALSKVFTSNNENISVSAFQNIPKKILEDENFNEEDFYKSFPSPDAINVLVKNYHKS